MKIKSLVAREILDSSGNPTIEAELSLGNEIIAVGAVPSGISTGTYEGFELRDGDLVRFGGLGVRKACNNINQRISPKLVNRDFHSQQELDQFLIDLDNTQNKSNLGANTILAVSIAYAQSQASYYHLPLYRFLVKEFNLQSDQSPALPKPLMVLIEGGKHAANSTDFQEYLIKVSGIKTTAAQIRAGQEIRMKLKELLSQLSLSTNVGTEGAFAPENLKNNEKPLELIQAAIESAGYQTDQVSLAIDAAADSFWQNKHYQLTLAKDKLSPGEMIDYLSQLAKKYPLSSIEDGLAEADFANWPTLKDRLDEVILIGDDLTVSQSELIDKYAQLGAISGVIIKMNQVGSISETIAAIEMAKKHHLEVIVSHRGSETTDTTLVDLAVAADADYIKVGPTRGERVVKYNRLMRIAEDLEKK